MFSLAVFSQLKHSTDILSLSAPVCSPASNFSCLLKQPKTFIHFIGRVIIISRLIILMFTSHLDTGSSVNNRRTRTSARANDTISLGVKKSFRSTQKIHQTSSSSFPLPVQQVSQNISFIVFVYFSRIAQTDSQMVLKVLPPQSICILSGSNTTTNKTTSVDATQVFPKPEHCTTAASH